jgi:hypothetical protein
MEELLRQGFSPQVNHLHPSMVCSQPHCTCCSRVHCA